MPLEQFITKRFGEDSLAVIDHANQIIAVYQAQGYVLTLRMLYYQFVARGLLPNTLREYKRLGDIIADGRLAGLIDWEAIEDHHREVNHAYSWQDPAHFLENVADQFKVDMWENQPHHCEVWIEKDALTGVIERPCKELRVAYFACKGYASASQLWAAGKRLAVKRQNKIDKAWGKKKPARGNARVVVFHLGDHDPSGIDMTRDNDDRLQMFSGGESNGVRIEVIRLALNMNQVQQYNPPPNPAKMTDSRSEGYVAMHGTSSWELDALDPAVIDKLVRDNVSKLIDKKIWKEDEEREAGHRRELHDVADNWDDIMSNM